MDHETTPALDPKEFRDALGTFATGVTVMTARAADGTPVGLTANSFNSVSLDPPMVLWSLAKMSLSRAVFMSAEYWAVHVLAADQEPLSNRFARSGADKFGGLEFEAGPTGVPLLKGCAARFQCKTSFQYEGGDHIIFVGEVTAFDRADRPPLVFHAGRYALATKNDRTLPQARSARVAGGLNEDFLGYSVSARELDAALSYVLDGPAAPVLQSLVPGGWVHIDGIDGQDATVYRLTATGRDRSLHLLAAAKAREVDLARVGYEDGAMLKVLLQQFIVATNPGLPDLWQNA